MPLKDIESEPWKDVCIDLSGPWKATIDGKEVYFHTLTAVDPFTGWPEITAITNKTAQSTMDHFEQEWLRRYPRPSRVIFDEGSEFKNRWLYQLATKWFFKPEPVTVMNPRANAIVERMHRVMGDMLRVQLVTHHTNDNPLQDLLSAVAYGIRATVHGTTLFTPGQLVFSKDMIMRTRIDADYELVRRRREAAAIKNNAKENKRRIAYKYEVGGKVLLLNKRLDPKLKLNRDLSRLLE